MTLNAERRRQRLCVSSWWWYGMVWYGSEKLNVASGTVALCCLFLCIHICVNENIRDRVNLVYLGLCLDCVSILLQLELVIWPIQ